jgi:hypothetical protein
MAAVAVYLAVARREGSSCIILFIARTVAPTMH